MVRRPTAMGRVPTAPSFPSRLDLPSRLEEATTGGAAQMYGLDDGSVAQGLNDMSQYPGPGPEYGVEHHFHGVPAGVGFASVNHPDRHGTLTPGDLRSDQRATDYKNTTPGSLGDPFQNTVRQQTTRRGRGRGRGRGRPSITRPRIGDHPQDDEGSYSEGEAQYADVPMNDAPPRADDDSLFLTDTSSADERRARSEARLNGSNVQSPQADTNDQNGTAQVNGPNGSAPVAPGTAALLKTQLQLEETPLYGIKRLPPRRTPAQSNADLHEIMSLRIEYNMQWNDICTVLNNRLIQQGNRPKHTDASVYGQFRRNGPGLMVEHGCPNFNFKEYMHLGPSKFP